MNSKKMIVNVPVATVWTSFDSAREIDQSALTRPMNIQNWLDSMDYGTLLDLCDGNRVQTQALYGHEVQVLSEKNGWSEVVVADQPTSKNENGYPGWIPTLQLSEAKDWNLHNGTIAAVTSKKAILFSNDMQPTLELSFETVLPVLKIEEERVIVKTPHGSGILQIHDVQIFSSQAERTKGNGEDLIKTGEQYLGLPYLWGGMSSYGYDCSGFSYTICKANGYIIPRDAHEQAKEGIPVELNDLKPGDLLFFAYEEGKGNIHHVGLYYGNGQLLHSPKTGKTIEITPLAGMEYEKELCAARRYWTTTEA